MRFPGSLPIATLVAAGVLLLGCGGGLRYTVPGTQRAVGAEAKIVAVVNPETSTTRLEIRAYELDPPDQLEEGTDTYVVWERPDTVHPFKRLGALRYDRYTHAGELLGATVSEPAFQLLITAETGPFPAVPSTYVVFEQVVEG